MIKAHVESVEVYDVTCERCMQSSCSLFALQVAVF